MNSPIKIILTGLTAFAAGAALVFYFIKTQPESAGAGGESAAKTPQLKYDANGEVIITLNAETQAHLGLKMAVLAAAQWQPEVKGYGRVIDPATLSAAVTDLESARSASLASTKEFARLKSLSEQNNISAKTLESAEATATHDKLVFKSTRARFAQDWGQSLADGDDQEQTLSAVLSGQTALVRLDLPAGEMLPAGPIGARVVALGDETNSMEASYLTTVPAMNPQTQGRSFLFLIKPNAVRLVAGEAVTGWLEISGKPVSGVVVPDDAVVHTDGRDWIYAQTTDDTFTRKEIMTDHPVAGGWFVDGTLSPGEKLVVAGAQQLLSTELISQSPPPS